MSWRMNSKPGFSSRRAMLPRVPVNRLSTHSTSSPRATSRSHKMAAEEAGAASDHDPSRAIASHAVDPVPNVTCRVRAMPNRAPDESASLSR